MMTLKYLRHISSGTHIPCKSNPGKIQKCGKYSMFDEQLLNHCSYRNSEARFKFLGKNGSRHHVLCFETMGINMSHDPTKWVKTTKRQNKRPSAQRDGGLLQLPLWVICLVMHTCQSFDGSGTIIFWMRQHFQLLIKQEPMPPTHLGYDLMTLPYISTPIQTQSA